MPVIISSIVRHFLTMFAGGLLTLGVAEAQVTDLANALEPVVSGVVLYGVGQAWSIIEKKSR